MSNGYGLQLGAELPKEQPAADERTAYAARKVLRPATVEVPA